MEAEIHAEKTARPTEEDGYAQIRGGFSDVHTYSDESWVALIDRLFIVGSVTHIELIYEN